MFNKIVWRLRLLNGEQLIPPHFRFLLILMGLFSCGESDPTTESPVDLSEAFQEMASIQCDKILSCCSADDLRVVFAGADVTSAEDCRSDVEQFNRAFLVPNLDSAQRSGSIEIDVAERSKCMEAIAAQACTTDIQPTTTLAFELEPCRKFIAPTLENSVFCTEDWECKSGLCAESASQLSCAAIPMTGAPCVGGRCSPNDFCSLDNVCTSRGEAGTTCDRNEACVSSICQDQAGDRVCAPVVTVCEGN